MTHRSPHARLAAALALAGALACTGRLEPLASKEPPVASSTSLDFTPAPLRMRRLLGWQYRNAVRDLLGESAAAAVSPPVDTAVNGFDAVGASQLSAPSTAIDAYETSALAAAKVALADTNDTRAALVGCTPKSVDDADCFTEFVTRFGHRAFRRPLEVDEVAQWVELGKIAATSTHDFHKGLVFVVAGMLESPNFLYVVETGDRDPMHPERVRLTGPEMATRLALFLTGTLPSDELLAAAEKGELATQDGVRRWATKLLQTAQAKQALASFFDELFRLRELKTLAKDTQTFPAFDSGLKASMQQETQLLVADLVWQRDADFREIFNADYTFVDEKLAALYSLPHESQGFVRVALPSDSRRGGLLGQASFLSLFSHTTTTSPTLRGKYVREILMCQSVGSPPPGTNPVLPEEKPGDAPRTMKERLEKHRTDPNCAACHVRMDGIGLGLENFDAIGAFRTQEKNGAAIDASSDAPGVGPFTGARELGAALRNDPTVATCLVRNLYRHANGHIEEAGEEPELQRLSESFSKHGFRLQSLLVDIAASDGFRYATAGGEP